MCYNYRKITEKCKKVLENQNIFDSSIIITIIKLLIQFTFSTSMNNLPIFTKKTPPIMHYISVSRGSIPFGHGDKISAIDATPTHRAYQWSYQIYWATDSAFKWFLAKSENYLDQAKKAVLVINGRPSVPEPHFTEQTAEEVRLMQELVATLLWVRKSSISPFSKFSNQDKDLDTREQNKRIRKKQESLSFLVSERTYKKILKSLWFSRDSSLEEIEHKNPLFLKGWVITTWISDDDWDVFIHIS